MTDLAGALQKAIYAKLAAVPGLPTVVAEVPINDQDQTVYPFTLLGDDDITDVGAKGDPLERHEVSIHVCMQSTTKLIVRGKQALVRDALQDQPLASAGAVLSVPVELSQITPLLEDGATYVGTQIFLVFAQQAN